MSRLPLVALHGFMGSPSTFKGLDTMLDQPVVALPLPEPKECAIGLSSCHDEIAAQLLQTLGAMGVSRFHLLGYSLGGRIAMHMARLRPASVDRLILESAHPGLRSADERQARCVHDAAWAERIRGEWPAILHSWYDQPVFGSLPDALRQELIMRKTGRDPETMARMLECLSLGRQCSFWEYLSRASHPILFVSGEMDERYRTIGERLAAQSGPTVHESVSGAGHIVHREQPEAYLAVLQSFLTQ